MCIQRKKALSAGIDFTVEYDNIAEDDELKQGASQFDVSAYSPIVMSDEKRIQ